MTASRRRAIGSMSPLLLYPGMSMLVLLLDTRIRQPCKEPPGRLGMMDRENLGHDAPDGTSPRSMLWVGRRESTHLSFACSPTFHASLTLTSGFERDYKQSTSSRGHSPPIPLRSAPLLLCLYKNSNQPLVKSLRCIINTIPAPSITSY